MDPLSVREVVREHSPEDVVEQKKKREEKRKRNKHKRDEARGETNEKVSA